MRALRIPSLLTNSSRCSHGQSGDWLDGVGGFVRALGRVELGSGAQQGTMHNEEFLYKRWGTTIR